MQKPTKAAFEQATALRKAGRTNSQVMEATGLSHSQVERHFVAEDIAKYGGFITNLPTTVTAQGALFARLREQGQSWGVIGVRVHWPESRVRKVFAEATGLRSQGMRIGKGGAYIAKDARFYQGAGRAQHGTELAVGQAIGAQVPAPNAPEQARKLPQFAAKGNERRTPAPRKPKA